MKLTQFSNLLICMVLLLAATSVHAVIYVDENFEGATALQNQNFPIRDTTSPADLSVKGCSIRTYGPAETDGTDSWGTVDDGHPWSAFNMDNTGTVVSTRRFLGAKSLQLASGQRVGPEAGMKHPWPRPEWWRFWQFAIATDSATANLPVGTEVGHFRIDWSTDGTDGTSPMTPNLTVEVTSELKFKVNASNELDIEVYNNTSKVATIGTVKPGPGNWKVLSIVAYGNYVDNGRFKMYDPTVPKYKGPQPTNPTVAPVANEDLTRYPLFTPGMHYFVDSNTTASSVSYTDMGNNWGMGADPTRRTYEVGWEIQAKNGGTLFIDNVGWQGNVIGLGAEGIFNQDGSARIIDFDAVTNEPGGPAEASVRHWDIY